MARRTESDLFDAITDGDLARVEALVRDDPSRVESTDRFGRWPLLCAVGADLRSPDIVRALLEAGADARRATDEGYTALHVMVDVNGPSGTGEIPGRIARLLVDAGTPLEARQHWGWTALMRAAVEGTRDELRALVDVGGAVDGTFPDHTLPAFLRGRTTLMATIPRPEKLLVLLGAGARVSAVDAHGQTAIAYARDLLAEAAVEAPTGRAAERRLDDACGSALDELARAGTDLDAIVDDAGRTLRSLLVSSLESALAAPREFDFDAAVRSSIRLLETWSGPR